MLTIACCAELSTWPSQSEHTKRVSQKKYGDSSGAGAGLWPGAGATDKVGAGCIFIGAGAKVGAGCISIGAGSKFQFSGAGAKVGAGCISIGVGSTFTSWRLVVVVVVGATDDGAGGMSDGAGVGCSKDGGEGESKGAGTDAG